MSTEKITSIKEFSKNIAEGYVVTTTKQVITFGIDNRSNCYEHWGYFTTNDDAQEFIDATLLDVTIVDSELNSEVFISKCNEQNIEPQSDECQMMFVNFTTTKGTLQFVAYNQHKGYYPHLAFITSRQLEKSVVLSCKKYVYLEK